MDDDRGTARRLGRIIYDACAFSLAAFGCLGANGRCDDVYRMKVSSAVNEVQAAMQMQAIPLEPAKTGNGKSNHEAYLEPKGKLVLPPESYQEDF